MQPQMPAQPYSSESLLPSDGQAIPRTTPPAATDVTAPTTDTGVPPSAAPQFAFDTQSAAFTGTTFAAFAGKAAYIDSALVRDQIRFRFDAAYNIDRADRSEFLYTTWQAFGGERPNPTDDPTSRPDPDIDRQTFWLYYERAVNRDFSVFVDVPFTFQNPSRNPNVEGFGDIEAGVKFSLYRDCCQQLTFQLKNYIPTGDAEDLWLGTGHYSIEPGLLYFRSLNDAWTLEAEVRDWIPIGGAVNPQNGEDYAGNVIRYGLGLGWDLWNGCGRSIQPIVEVVGWSFLDGQVFEFDANDADLGVFDADGDTVINLKIGTRITNCCGGSLYAGWGHPLTGDQLYRDIFRLELRRMF
jgi:hypothetical protein